MDDTGKAVTTPNADLCYNYNASLTNQLQHIKTEKDQMSSKGQKFFQLLKTHPSKAGFTPS